MTHIDNPEQNDNRRYDYASCQSQQRPEYSAIAALIQPGSTAIDFGCGNGSLLELLKRDKGVAGTGYDISPTGVEAASKKGILAVCAPIDQVHPELMDGQFDYAICNVTLQMVMYPEILMREMRRVSKYQIVSFPNFAFYLNRMEMLFMGRMPRRLLYGYTWYSTGHIHQLSISDFETLVKDVGGLKILERRSSSPYDNVLRRVLSSSFPNMFESIPIFLLTGTNA